MWNVWYYGEIAKSTVTINVLNWPGMIRELGKQSFYCLPRDSKCLIWFFSVRMLKNFSYKPHSHYFTGKRNSGIFKNRTNL